MRFGLGRSNNKRLVMNFNVHRRNRSLVGQPSQRERKEGRSLKKVPYTCPGQALLSEAKDIYHSQGDLEQAARLFSQYLALYPKNSEALYLCAVCELRTEQYQNALLHLSTLPDDYPHRPNALLLSAMALNKLGKTTQSLQLVNQCVNRYEGFEEAVCFRGKLYMGLNYYHRAEQDFKALAAKPNASFLPHNSLGDCYRAQNKPQKAIGPYLRALQLLEGGGQSLIRELQLKVGICLYQLERWSEARRTLQQVGKGEGSRNCQYFYYLGGCMVKMGERQKGLLNLQYCLRTQGSTRLMRRAFKKLIQLYLENYQFYEALNVVRLGEISGLKLEGWGTVVQAFMLIIKGAFQEGLKSLNETIIHLKQSEEGKRLLKIKRDSSHGKAVKDSRYNQTSAFSKKLLAASPGRFNSKDINRESGRVKPGKLGYFSTKSVLRAVPKIESLRIVERGGLSIKKNDQVRVKTQYVQREQGRQFYVGRQKEFMLPMILQFKAYAQFFQGNYLQCLDTYEEYETFLKDNFGRQSDVTYNKSLCEGLLMAESDMHEQALTKYGACLDIYYQKNSIIPPQPLLYKIVLLVKLGIERAVEEQSNIKRILQEQASSKQILQSTLQLMQNYQPVLAVNSLALYFRALVCLLLDRWEECREWLEKALKIAEDCSWRCLWVKGVVEMRKGNYYEAVKEFSAGLILQSRAQLFLGRSISFLLLSEQAQKNGRVEQVKALMRSVHLGENTQTKKNSQTSKQAKNRSDMLIQNCFQDLQKYIELQTRQQDISLWVSKILFRNKAYDQAIRSLVKITIRTPQVNEMIQAVAIYEGQLERGGPVGLVIKSAFQGAYLNTHEEEKLLQGQTHRQIAGGEWLQRDYQRWIIALHLYVRQNYTLLLKYLQRELFGCQEGNTHLLLKYNIAITYLLLGELKKAINVLRGLSTPCLQQKMQKLVTRFEGGSFDQDECLQDLREEVGITCSKLLSNYLPYRSVKLGNDTSSLRIYVRPSIPFPQFASPSLQIQVGMNFVGEEVVTSAVEKRLQAPWIRKTECKTVQFTQKLQESGVYLTGETTSVKEEILGGSFFLQ